MNENKVHSSTELSLTKFYYTYKCWNLQLFLGWNKLFKICDVLCRKAKDLGEFRGWQVL